MTDPADYAAVAERQRDRLVQHARARVAQADRKLLDSPEAQPLQHRMYSTGVDRDCPFAIEQVENVTLVVLKALASGRPVHERIAKGRAA